MSGCGQGFEPQVKEYLAQVSSANSKVEIRQHAQLKKEYNSAENGINKVVWVHVHYLVSVPLQSISWFMDCLCVFFGTTNNGVLLNTLQDHNLKSE